MLKLPTKAVTIWLRSDIVVNGRKKTKENEKVQRKKLKKYVQKRSISISSKETISKVAKVRIDSFTLTFLRTPEIIF